MLISPDTTKPLRELAEVLLRGPNSLTPAEREMIATYVSSENDCYYCQHSHGAAAAEHLGGNYGLIDQIKQNFSGAPVSEKLKALLLIAGKVQKGGKNWLLPRTPSGPRKGRDGQRDSRHRPDRRRLLHVQPLRRRPWHLAAARYRRLPRNWLCAWSITATRRLDGKNQYPQRQVSRNSCQKTSPDNVIATPSKISFLPRPRLSLLLAPSRN